MTFKKGKYKIRGGNDAEVLWTDHTYLIGIYYVEDFNGEKTPFAIRWFNNGVFRLDGAPSHLDLIGE